MNKPLGNPGRPVKAPSESALNELGGLTWVVDGARAILKEHGAPSSWGDDELGLILKFMRFPFVFDALSDLKRSDRQDKRSKLLIRHKTTNALKWAKMFADAPRTMIHALPKLEALVDSFSGETRSQNKRLRNVCQEVVFYFVRSNEIERCHGSTRFSKWFWNEKANVIADELSQRLDLTVTPHIIEDARAEIRRRLK